MDLPILDQTGELDVEAVNQLSRQDLRDWLYARLHNRDFTVPLDARQDEPSYLVFVRMYDEVDRDTRAYVRSIVHELLREVAHRRETGDESAWSSEEIVDLLLLTQHLDEDEFVQPVLQMVREEVFLNDPQDVNVHYWLVQTLVALGWNHALPEFWVRQLQVDPQEFSVLVFTALSRISPNAAAQVLPQIDWGDDEVAGRMRRALPALEDEYSRSEVIAAISMVWSDLPSRARDVLSSVFPDFGAVQGEKQFGLPLTTPLRARLRRHIIQRHHRERTYEPTLPSSLLGVIGPSEAQIFILYHGFGIDRKYTFIEIGDSLDLKACNVRETYTHAMKRVRRYVRRTTVESGTSNVLAYLKEKLPVEYPTAMIDG